MRQSLTEKKNIWHRKYRLKDISTPDFSTSSFNPRPFNPKLFNHELSNPRLFNHEFFYPRLLIPRLFNTKSGIEKSGVEMSSFIGRVYFLLRFFSSSQIHLRFKTEEPSQLLLKCEKVCILKSP